MKHIRCAVCGRDIHYTQAVHVRDHEMTDVYRFRTQPMEYFDMCRSNSHYDRKLKEWVPDEEE